jgi:hypothetical protein
MVKLQFDGWVSEPVELAIEFPISEASAMPQESLIALMSPPAEL